MMVFKRKQMITLSLIIMVIVAGYLQYNYKDTGISANKEIRERLGEAVYVDNKAPEKQKMKDINKKNGPNCNIKEEAHECNHENKQRINEPKETTKPISKLASDFFVQAKLDKETKLEKEREELKNIIDNPNSTQDSKDSAHKKMLEMISSSEKESKIETLLREKGFSSSVVYFGSDGSLDIVVKSPGLSSVDVAQIADVATRYGNLSMELIHIRNMY
jgi:stage III sporulation protein AH